MNHKRLWKSIQIRPELASLMALTHHHYKSYFNKIKFSSDSSRWILRDYTSEKFNQTKLEMFISLNITLCFQKYEEKKA